ncbi:hypothetical protein DEO72_LG10g3316 [Vigna unguiculata]|uniref:F-box domain-containing protein n=1 Tax=Vigna unguiculata TaxID=3917 RepID=A0A4D6NIX0_VIGUN|nr:hypothetical protein DEO72_LG10g3315 [Vigna unguiculata]QCE12076.1 hypothetical protein DEO72_LG10g3316 [Vigna unguiculata]
MLCEDALLEILSRLPVKSLKRFMCVSKYFQSIILDARFLRMHLENSRKRTHFLLSYLSEGKTSGFLIPLPISSLLEDSTPLFNADIINGSKPQREMYKVIGSCNGLVCLTKWNRMLPDILYLWNPATKALIQNPYPPHSEQLSLKLHEKENVVMVGFGYDNSRHSYKVVAIFGHMMDFEGDNHPFRSVICNLNDKIGWKDIQDFPVDPTAMKGNGIYLNNTLNWLGSPYCNIYDEDGSYILFDEVVIVSLDLETEIYKQILLPSKLNGVSVGDFCFRVGKLHCNEAPLIGVLSGCLSLFLHNRKKKRLSIWQMKEFGNQQSWTLLLNVSLRDLGFNTIRSPTNFGYDYYLWTLENQHFSCSYSNFLPLCLIENDRDIVIIHGSFQGCVKQTIVYNLRDKTMTSKKMVHNLRWIYPLDYVESLVSPLLD